MGQPSCVLAEVNCETVVLSWCCADKKQAGENRVGQPPENVVEFPIVARYTFVQLEPLGDGDDFLAVGDVAHVAAELAIGPQVTADECGPFSQSMRFSACEPQVRSSPWSATTAGDRRPAL